MNYYVTALKKYVDFNGRAGRGEFWIFMMINQLILMILYFVFRYSQLTIIANLFALATIIPTISAGFRRMHDVGKKVFFYSFIWSNSCNNRRERWRK